MVADNTSADEANAGPTAAVDVSSSSSSSSKSVTGAGGEDGSNKNSDTGTANEGQGGSSAIEAPSADSVLITAVGDGSEEGTPGQPAASGDDAASNIEGEGNAEGRESGTAFGEDAATSDEVDPEAQAATAAAAAAAALEAESARIRKNAARARKKAGGTASSDDLITRAVFDELKQQFWDSSTGHVKKDSLGIDLNDLVAAVHMHSDRRGNAEDDSEQLEILFNRIDTSQDGYVSWEEFASYVLLSLQKREDALTRGRQLPLAASVHTSNPHGSMVTRVRITDQRHPMTLSDDGTLCDWPPSLSRDSPYQPLRNISLVLSDIPTKETPGMKRKPKWATDFISMPHIFKFVVSSGERELWFYDAATEFQPQFVITGFQTTPARLATTHDPKSGTSTLLFGGAQGGLGVVIFPKTYGQNKHFRVRITKGKPPVRIHADKLTTMGRPSEEYGGVHIRQWHGHCDWVNELAWIPTLGSFVSCSSDPKASLIIGEIIPQRTAPPKSLGRSLLAQPDHGKIDGMFVNPYQTTFAVQRGGVRTFDYSAKVGLVASGGTDRVVRFWSPWLKTHASFSLHGHETSVIGVNYMPDGVRLATLDVSRVVRIWDSKGQCGVSVITEGFHGITTDAYALHVNQNNGAIMLLAPKEIAIIEPKRGLQEGTVVSHEAPVRCMVYNVRFGQVITACENGILKVWSISTGSTVIEFRVSSGAGTPSSPICSIALDDTSTRVVVACEDGSVSAWAIGNGRYIREYVENTKFLEGERVEVSDALFIREGQVRTVITVGWSRKINVFPDARNLEHVAVMVPENDHWDHSTPHKDDILCACHAGKNQLASASYDGEIIIWNTASGAIYKRIPPALIPGFQQNPEGVQSSSGGGGGASVKMLHSVKAIYKLVSIPNKVRADRGPTLIACASSGIFFWDARRGVSGQLLAAFRPEGPADVEVRAACISSDATTFVIGDTAGYVTVFDITGYGCGAADAVGGVFEKAISARPPVIGKWRGSHQKSISAVALAENSASSSASASSSSTPSSSSTDVPTSTSSSSSAFSSPHHVITSSTDFKARLWTLQGDFVGTFGQLDQWELDERLTWEYPKIPAELIEADDLARRLAEEEAKLESMFGADAKITRAKSAVRRSSAAWQMDDDIDENELKQFQEQMDAAEAAAEAAELAILEEGPESTPASGAASPTVSVPSSRGSSKPSSRLTSPSGSRPSSGRRTGTGSSTSSRRRSRLSSLSSSRRSGSGGGGGVDDDDDDTDDGSDLGIIDDDGEGDFDEEDTLANAFQPTFNATPAKGLRPGAAAVAAMSSRLGREKASPKRVAAAKSLNIFRGAVRRVLSAPIAREGSARYRTAASKVGMLSYIGNAGTNLYSRRQLYNPTSAEERWRAMSAPAERAVGGGAGAGADAGAGAGGGGGGKGKKKVRKLTAKQRRAADADWLEPGLPRRVGNWERYHRFSQSRDAAARVGTGASRRFSDRPATAAARLSSSVSSSSARPQSAAAGFAGGRRAAGGGGSGSVGRPSSGYRPMAAKIKTDAASKVYTDMKLLGLEEIKARAAPDLGTSVMARLLAGAGNNHDGGKGGKGGGKRGGKKGAGGGGRTVIPRHSKNQYKLSLTETPESLKQAEAEDERLRIESRNDLSNHDERRDAAIASSQRGKRKSVIVPGMNLT